MHEAGDDNLLWALGIVFCYFGFVCTCVCVGPVRIIKCLLVSVLVSDATVPEEIPILNWFGWGLGAGPFLTKVLVGLCHVPDSCNDEGSDEETV